jgi:hypothetical protein
MPLYANVIFSATSRLPSRWIVTATFASGSEYDFA